MSFPDIFNPHLFQRHYYAVPAPKTAHLMRTMITRGDIEPTAQLARPKSGKYERVTLDKFMETKVVPQTLLDSVAMARGEWYYYSYSTWFDFFLWRVFRLADEQSRRVK